VTRVLTKSELIEQVSELLKLPNGKAEQIVNCIFDSMVTALQEGDGIEIRGFGSFTVREYRAYEGRNPRTGETVHVAPKRLPFFKVGKDLRDRVNRAAGTGGLDESPDSDDDDDDVVDLDEMDEPDDTGDGDAGGNGRSRASGAGWNGNERASEHRATGDGRNFGQSPDRDSSDAG
jgi:integration host factor subunit beta